MSKASKLSRMENTVLESTGIDYTPSGETSGLVFIKSDGYVGIGTANPVNQLHINQSDFSGTWGQGQGDGGLKFQEGSSTWTMNLQKHSNPSIYFSYNNERSAYIRYGVNDLDINFTGQHRCILNKNLDQTSKGLIVSSSGKYMNLDNSLNTNINESLPICTITNIDNDIKIFGVISDKEDTNNTRNRESGAFVTPYEKANKNEQRMYINSLGEGAIWVCDKNSNLINGEYISSSSVPGYGMKQVANELLNLTVAKITCDCDFSLTKIVKQKLKVITITETYEENVYEETEKTNTETKIEYDETLQRYVQKEITNTTTEKQKLYDTVDLYNEAGEVIGTHQVESKETKTKTVTEIDYDENGDVQYEDDLDENGAQQMVYKYDTRFLQADGTQLVDETDYNTRLANGESVYIACFVGCTYHCG